MCVDVCVQRFLCYKTTLLQGVAIVIQQTNFVAVDLKPWTPLCVCVCVCMYMYIYIYIYIGVFVF